jgi:hypothetical protein
LALISIKLKIVKASDGTALPDNTRLAPINNVLGSVFSDCKIWFNDKQVSDTTQCYNYKNYIEATLNANMSVKQSFLSVSGYVEDVYTMFDDKSGTANT